LDGGAGRPNGDWNAFKDVFLADDQKKKRRLEINYGSFFGEFGGYL
jgi:hypothetical protein